MRKYKYNKKAGSLQDAYAQDDAPPPPPARPSNMTSLSSLSSPSFAAGTAFNDIETTGEFNIPPGVLQQLQQTHNAPMRTRAMQAPNMARPMSPPAPPAHNHGGLDHQARQTYQKSMFFYTVEEGQQVLVVSKDGSMEVVRGPKRVWRKGRKIRSMQHFVAHPGEFLLVRYRDGRQEHVAGPAHVWLDPREHLEITREEALPIGAKEAVVVYSEDKESKKVSRRIVYGPATFIPSPGEWLHTFSWHGTAPGKDNTYHKIPNALVFQKLWMMPDQMYHDVTDVRTADDALLTIRLMIFFELCDVLQMLESTHDPIGDFINAATSDVIEFMSRHDFESFKHNTSKLNDIATYQQLTTRAEQCGYKIDKVVYRGYGAPARLQTMHDEAIESRTRLQLERATQQQAQELEDFTLERTLARHNTKRVDESESIQHQIQINQQQTRAKLEAARLQAEHQRQERAAAAAQEQRIQAEQDALKIQYYQALQNLGVDLTAYLTQHRADQVIEVRGEKATPHIHMKDS